MSTDPDELYTLRAQYWLGHYALAVEEAKAIARRPMSPQLKSEREEYLARAYIGLKQYDKVSGGDSVAMQALALKAQYDAASGNESVQAGLVDQIKSLVAGTSSGDPGTASVQLTASHVLSSAGQIKEALQCVHANSTPEHMIAALQLYVQLERLDLARKQQQLLRNLDEDSILAQLAGVYVSLATGSTGAGDAVHAINSLTEQYGTSTLLANLMACALLQQGDYAGAEQTLQEALMDAQSSGSGTADADTLVNLICSGVHQNKAVDEYIQQLQAASPTHAFCVGLERVTTAFDREAIKYKV